MAIRRAGDWVRISAREAANLAHPVGLTITAKSAMASSHSNVVTLQGWTTGLVSNVSVVSQSDTNDRSRRDTSIAAKALPVEGIPATPKLTTRAEATGQKGKAGR